MEINLPSQMTLKLKLYRLRQVMYLQVIEVQ